MRYLPAAITRPAGVLGLAAVALAGAGHALAHLLRPAR